MIHEECLEARITHQSSKHVKAIILMMMIKCCKTHFMIEGKIKQRNKKPQMLPDTYFAFK